MIKIKKNRLVLIIIGVILATLLTTAGVFYLYSNLADVTFIKKSTYEEMKLISDKYQKLYKIQNTLNQDGLWDVDEDVQMEAIYDGLMGSLNDEYSSYMNAGEVKEWEDYLNGSFSGVGINFKKNDKGEFEVVGIIEDSPAASSEIKTGDILLKVDGKEYDDINKLAQAIRGKEGSKVEITYIRDGKQKNVTLVRAIVKEKTVYSSEIDGVGYIAIKAFEEGTADEFKSELAKLENKQIKNLVIDIRNNGGGYTDEGIKIADMLLPECTITYMEDKHGKKTTYNSDEKRTSLNYVLLVNENTASTSEILAAAIKDNKGGAIVGTTTFGKGIVQGTYDLKDGTAIKLTIMQYFSPNGDKIHKVGVKPDYEVKISDDTKTDVQFEKAVSLF